MKEKQKIAVASRPFAEALLEAARQDERIVCVTNDLTASCEVDQFREEFPERYYSLGMAEQNLAGVLAGLAREGLRPIYASFSVFVTRRPWEQLALSVAYPNLPVRLLGFLPGLVTPGGVTHQAIDDLALMSLLPNMTVLETGDATEVETMLGAVSELDGPVFVRMLRGQVPRRFETPLEIGRSRKLSDGTELLVLSCGISTAHAAEAVAAARSEGVDVQHRHVSTLKPFDDRELFAAIAAASAGVVTVENHLIRGGLGTAVAEHIAEAGLGRPLRRVGIRDSFTHGGDCDYLLDYYGLSAQHVLAAIAELAGFDLGERSPQTSDATGSAHRAEVAEGL